MLVVLQLSTQGAAQIPIDMIGSPIVEVEVAGETAGITEERELGIPSGARLSRPLLRAALERLASSGSWANAQVDVLRVSGGVRVVVHLVPRVLVTRVDIRGNRVAGDDELTRAMDLSAGAELHADTPTRVSSAIAQVYRERGYERARAEVLVRDTDDPTRKVLVVDVEEGEPTRIGRVQFQGEAPPAQSGAGPALGVEVGDVLDRRALGDAAARAEARMRERGWLEAELGEPLVGMVGGRVVVSIPSRPGPRYALQLRGAEPLDRGDVEEVLDLASERLTDAVVESLVERVQDLYLRHGFIDASVRVRRVAGSRQGRALLVIEIEPGEQLRVVAVAFPGARHFDTVFLREQLFSYLYEDLPGAAICAHSPWSRCRSRDPVDTETADAIGLGGSRRPRREVARPLVVDAQHVFYEPTYAQALEHIQELLQADGYLDAEVGPARIERVGGRRAVVEVPVREGPRTTLHRMTLRGNQSIDSRSILVAAGLERRQAFSHLSLAEARLRIVELYQESGRLYARVEPTVRFSGDRTRAEVMLEIVEGPEVRVGRVIVRGAAQTNEALILDRLAFGPGDVFRPSLARRSQERLLELGIFSAVNVTPQDPELPSTVKSIVVTVTERKWGFLELSGGFSTGEGVRGSFGFGVRNVGGYGVGITVGIRASFQFFFVDEEVRRRFEALSLDERLEGRFTVGATIPHLPVPDLRLSLDAGFFQDNERDFGINRFAASATFTWRPTRRFSLGPYFEIERNDVNLFVEDELEAYLRRNMDPRLERLLRVPDGGSILGAAGSKVSIDLRDHPFLTTRGFFATVGAEYARTFSTEAQAELDEPFRSHFVKLNLTTSGYVPLADRVVLATQLQLGGILHLARDSKTYPNRSFFVGGVETMRGYLQDSLIPQDVADQIIADETLGPNDVFRGGDALVLLRSELRFPIPVADWLYGGIFAELGNLWADPGRVQPLDLRPSAGGGLRAETPVGPIALDIGFLLLRRAELAEDPWALHFSIGLF